MKAVAVGDERSIGASFTKYQIGVTQFKDTENYLTSPFCIYNPGGCPLTFDDYLDGDNLVEEDLVIWASIGMMHLPGAEDAPSTESIGHTGSILIRPHNYFDEDPGMVTRNGPIYRRDTPDGSVQQDQAIKEGKPCIQNKSNVPEYDGNAVVLE